MFTRVCRTFNRRRLVFGFWAFLLFTIAALVLGLAKIRRDHRQDVRQADTQRGQLVTRIHDSLMRATHVVDQIATEIGSETRSMEGNRALIDSLLRARPCVFGAGFALDPAWVRTHRAAFLGTALEQWSDSLGQVSVYVVRQKGGAGLERRAIRYDYTDTSSATAVWYTQAARGDDSAWAGPYFGSAAQTNLVSYTRRILDANGQLMGVAFADYALSALRSRMAVSNATQQGYSTLLTGDGTILYHPRVELMDGQSTIRDIGTTTGNTSLVVFADSIAARSPSGNIVYRSIFTGEKAHLKYQRMEDVGWYVLSVVPDSKSQPLCTYQRHVFLFVLAFTILLCWGWGLLWSRRLWVASLGISLFLSMGIVALCWLAVAKFESGICTTIDVLVKGGSSEKKPEADCSRTPLSNAFAASAFMNRCFELDGSVRSIPTGILIQTVNFTSAYSFSVSGYVWQKYRDRADTSILGIEFPENEDVTMEDSYDDSIGPQEFVRGWRFIAEIRQPFEYRLYPLDKEEIWIRMQPKGLNQSVMLEPDFLSYHRTSGTLFGIDQNLVLPQWKILSTNFSFSKNASSSSYGRGAFRNQGEYPELYFSIHIRRNIFDAFISQFIPLMVIILMLFSILWVGRKKDDPGLLGFNALSGASGCSAVFFIVIYNHISIRNMLGAPGVVYMECYFFVTYLAILYVSLNSILVAMDHKTIFINHCDNLISRLLYWPLVTGILFVCTFVAFF